MWSNVTERKVKIQRVTVSQANGEGADAILDTQVFLIAEKITSPEAQVLPRGIAVEGLVEDQNANAGDKVEKATDRLGMGRVGRTLQYKLIAPSGEILFEGVAQERGTPRYVVAQGNRPSLYWCIGIQVSPDVEAAVAAHTNKLAGVRLTVDGALQRDLFEGENKKDGNGKAKEKSAGAVEGVSRRRGRPPLTDEEKAKRAADKEARDKAKQRPAGLETH